MDSPLYREYRKPLSRRGELLQAGEASAYGYPVKSAKDLGLDEFFKSRQDVAGMAWGGGENGSELSEPRTVVHNPYNQYMSDPVKRKALYKVEAARHLMSSNPVPKFKISPALQKWREANFKKGDPYRENDDNFRETVVSRILVGDTGANGDMPFDPEPNKVASQFNRKLDGAKTSEFMRTMDRRRNWWE